MVTHVVMPQIGYDMAEGAVAKWLKQVGDEISEGDVIAEIETDKSNVEMEVRAAGIIGKIVVAAGQTVPVGTIIAIIVKPGEEVPSLETLNAQEIPPEPPKQKNLSYSTETTSTPTSPDLRATPVARRLAREYGVELSKVIGTGPSGRITEADVETHKKTIVDSITTPDAPSTGQTQVELTRMRLAIASNVVRSKREAPHFYVTSEIDMGKSMALRLNMNTELPAGARISVNDMIIKACTQAIVKYPNFNASFQGDHITVNSHINIGIAIALNDGLIVAAIPDCQNLALVDIAKASSDLTKRAHDGTLQVQEHSGSTFAISNLGMYDVDSFSAIILPPHAAVLAVGSVKEQPVARDGQITISQIMKTTISVDHRVVDGAEAARFLQELKCALQNPDSLLG